MGATNQDGVGDTGREGQGRPTSHTAVLRQEGARLLKLKKDESRWQVARGPERTTAGPW